MPTPFEDWLERNATLLETLNSKFLESGTSIEHTGQASTTLHDGVERYLQDLLLLDSTASGQKGYRATHNSLRRALAGGLSRQFDIQLLVTQAFAGSLFPLANPIPFNDIEDGVTVSPEGSVTITWTGSPAHVIDRDQLGVEASGRVSLEVFQTEFQFRLLVDYAIQVRGNQVLLRLARRPRVVGVPGPPLNPGIRRSLQAEVDKLPANEFERAIAIPVAVPNPIDQSPLHAIGIRIFSSTAGFFYRAGDRPFRALSVETTIPGGVQSEIVIHKSVIDKSVNLALDQILESVRAGLDDGQELLASLESITFEEASQSIAIVLSAEIKIKKKFDVEIPLPYIPYGGGGVPVGSVTMRVSKKRTLLIRATPATVGGVLELNIRQDQVLNDENPDISFSPDLVNILTAPMHDFAALAVNLIVALGPRLSETVTVIDQVPQITVDDFHIAPDRLVVLVRIST